MIPNDTVPLIRKWLEALDKKVTAEWKTWTPTVTCSGAMTASAVTGTSDYFILGSICFFYFSLSMTLGGTASNFIYVNAPPPPVVITTPYLLTAADLGEVSLRDVLFMDTYPGTPRQFRCRSGVAAANWNLGAGKYVEGIGFFRIA